MRSLGTKLLACWTLAPRRRDKGKPVARRGRKAHGPPARGRRPGCRREVSVDNPHPTTRSQARERPIVGLGEARPPAAPSVFGRARALARSVVGAEAPLLAALETLERLRDPTGEDPFARHTGMAGWSLCPIAPMTRCCARGGDPQARLHHSRPRSTRWGWRRTARAARWDTGAGAHQGPQPKTPVRGHGTGGRRGVTDGVGRGDSRRGGTAHRPLDLLRPSLGPIQLSAWRDCLINRCGDWIARF